MSSDDHQHKTNHDVAVFARRRPRVWTSVIAITAVILGAAFLLGQEGAGAMGGRNFQAMQVPEAAPATSSVDTGGEPTQTRLRSEPSLGLAVCVRLCDGYFFPINAATGGEATCNAQCPDAPSALYRELAGSDNIEDAISATGTPYSALPAAGRYRSIVDGACTCHRKNVNYSKMILKDPTLRKGDMVMTPTGLVVYEGSNNSVVRQEDFVAVAQSRLAPAKMRDDLSKLRSSGDGGWGFVSTAPAIGKLGLLLAP
jgi:Protein of unknown function (DUF2865)